jgi:hypothetical protein
LPQIFTAAWCCRYERAEKAAEEDKKEDPTLLRQPLYCCFAVCNPQRDASSRTQAVADAGGTDRRFKRKQEVG